MKEPIKIILHRHMNPFELQLTKSGIRWGINFEEAMVSAMKEYAEQEKEVGVRKIVRSEVPMVFLRSCSLDEQLPNIQCTVCGRTQQQMLKYKCTSSACPN